MSDEPSGKAGRRWLAHCCVLGVAATLGGLVFPGIGSEADTVELNFAATATSLGAGYVVQFGGPWLKLPAQNILLHPRDPFPSCNR